MHTCLLIFNLKVILLSLQNRIANMVEKNVLAFMPQICVKYILYKVLSHSYEDTVFPNGNSQELSKQQAGAKKGW